MKVTINKTDSFATALEHSLKTVLGLPAEAVVVSDSEPTSVLAADGQTYRGVAAILQVARAAEVGADAAKKAFLSGSNEEERSLINQWVSVAAILSAETKAHPDGTSSVTPTLADVERILETHNLQGKFLAGTAHATIGDVLVYGAIHNGRPEAATKALPPFVFDWSIHAQADASVAPIKSNYVSKGKSSAAAAGGATTSAYVKPSDEEIQRRREEKEKAKKEKEAAKAAAAAAASASGGGAAPAPAASEKPEEEEKKKEKKQKPLKESTKNPPKKELDASNLDVRVGRFTNVRKHPTADKLYVEDMDLGEEKRTIVSGLVQHFADPAELEGKLILVMCNMKPKALLGVTSHGMILCASNDEGLSLVSPPEGAKPGDRIVFGEQYTEPGLAPEVPSSNKMAEVLSHLRTNGDGVLCWKDTPAFHANGIICCPTRKNCVVK